VKNLSLYAIVAVLALAGAAIWYEVQYRQASTSPAGTPIRHVSATKRAATKPAPQGPVAPTNERGQMIG
jgi:cytoskeletal protein RodZ